MARLGETTASLRVLGDGLVPAEVTARLGHAPTRAWAKATRLGPRGGGRPNLALRGVWLLNAAPCRPGNPGDRIAGLLNRLTPDLGIRQDLALRLRSDLNCGLRLDGSNEEDLLSPRTLTALRGRRLQLSLDITAPWGPDDEEP
jgi:hypothetical protein